MSLIQDYDKYVIVEYKLLFRNKHKLMLKSD